MKPLENARILLWAAEPESFAAIAESVGRLGGRVVPASSLPELTTSYVADQADLIVVQLSRSTPSLLGFLSDLNRARPAVPVLVIVDVWDKDLYVQAIRCGAFDGLALPIDEKELVRVASNALQLGRSKLCA